MNDFVVPAIAVATMAVVAIYFALHIGAEKKSLANRLEELERFAHPTGSTENGTPVGNHARAIADARSIWHEWSESLVHSRRNSTTYRTLDAEHIFTPERLVPGVSKFRGLTAAPSIFTGLGVFFTFIGLAVGFLGLNLGSDATSADSIVESAGRLVSAAGIAFTASIVGVGLSLVYNLVEKRVERTAVSRVVVFQQRMNDAYPLLTPEHSLVQIADLQKQSTEALQELHERIGNRMQEALEQQATTIRDQLATSISEALTPAMATLVSATTAQSSTVFESLIERFASSFGELGEQQRSAMDDASARLQTAIDGLGSQVTAVTEELRAQSVELVAQQKLVLQSLGEVSAALTASAADLDGTAGSLATISERFEEASKHLAGDLSSATTMLDSVLARIDEQASRGAELTNATTILGEGIAKAAADVTAATSNIGQQLSAFAQVQQAFRAELAGNATALADELKVHVEQLSQQVANWLGKYSADVEQQIESRMERWNSVSQDYATMMLATAQALSDAVEELSNKGSRQVDEVAA